MSNMLEKRYYSICEDDNGNRYYCYSAWSNWGRWVLLVIVLLAIFGIAFAVSLIHARRRRRRGMQPVYGTGWLGRGTAPQQGNYIPGRGQVFGQEATQLETTYGNAPYGNVQQEHKYGPAANEVPSTEYTRMTGQTNHV